MLQSSAYLQKRRPRPASALSRSSSTRWLRMGESGPPCGVPSSTDQTVFHHPGVEERPDEFKHTLIGLPRGDARHQAVVIDSVEKLFEIEIDHDVVAVGDVTLRLSPCLMGGAPRSKAVTVLGERGVPPLLGLIDSWCKSFPTAASCERGADRRRRGHTWHA